MSKQIYFKQCSLSRKLDDSRVQEMTTWIPEQFAKVGKYLEILQDGEWVNGWKVKWTSTVRLTEEYVRARSRDHLHTREASDV